GAAGRLAADQLRLDAPVGADELQVGAPEPDAAGVVTGPVLRPPLARAAELEPRAAERRHHVADGDAQRRAPVQRLAGVLIDLRIEMKLLLARRVVRGRRR